MIKPRQAPRAAGDHGTTPITPARPRSAAALNELIRQLNVEHQLHLPVRDENWSPSKNANSPTLADKIVGQIKRMYFSAGPALQRVLDDYKTKAANLQQRERLNLLHLLLRSQTSSPSARVTGTQTPRDDPHKSLRSSTRKLHMLLGSIFFGLDARLRASIFTQNHIMILVCCLLIYCILHLVRSAPSTVVASLRWTITLFLRLSLFRNLSKSQTSELRSQLERIIR